MKYTMEVIDRCNLNLTTFQIKRINDFCRMDKDGMMDLQQIMDVVNRSFNEQVRQLGRQLPRSVAPCAPRRSPAPSEPLHHGGRPADHTACVHALSRAFPRRYDR